MEVSSKTDRAAQSEARSTTDGFESWKPPAPGMGLNSGLVSFRGRRSAGAESKLTIIHFEPHRSIPAIPPGQTVSEPRGILARAIIDLAMPLMHEQTGHSTGPGIAVFVRAPSREVDVPVVQVQDDVCVGMGQIPADDEAAELGVRSDLGDVEELAGVVLDAREEDERGLGGVLVDVGEDSLGGDFVLSVFRADEDHGLFWVQAVPGDVGFDGELCCQDRGTE